MSTSTRGHRQSGSHPRHRRAMRTKNQGTINGVKYAVMDGAGKIRAALSEATGEVLESLGTVRDSATARARDGLETVHETASDYVAQGKSQAHEAEAAVEETIRNQPLTSVLIAAGAGFLIGALWFRR